MFRNVTVALLLTTCLVSHAVAAEEAITETSQKARKLNAYLDNVGINNPAIREIVSEFSARKEGKYLRLGEERFESGSRIVMHYKMQPKIGLKQMQLKYQSSDQKTEVMFSTKAVMYNYKWSF